MRIYDSTGAKVSLKHPEVIPHWEALPQALAKPDAIYAGNLPGSYVFESNEPSHEGHPLVASVKVVEGTSARLSTCYFTSSYSTGGTPIWTPDDDK